MPGRNLPPSRQFLDRTQTDFQHHVNHTLAIPAPSRPHVGDSHIFSTAPTRFSYNVHRTWAIPLPSPGIAYRHDSLTSAAPGRFPAPSRPHEPASRPHPGDFQRNVESIAPGRVPHLLDRTWSIPTPSRPPSRFSSNFSTAQGRFQHSVDCAWPMPAPVRFRHLLHRTAIPPPSRSHLPAFLTAPGRFPNYTWKISSRMSTAPGRFPHLPDHTWAISCTMSNALRRFPYLVDCTGAIASPPQHNVDRTWAIPAPSGPRLSDSRTFSTAPG